MRISMISCLIFLSLAAAGPEVSSSSPLSAIQATIEDGFATEAVPELERRIAAEPENADLHNLMGFALRHLSRFAEARDAYERALTLAPKHRGALEYMGEMEVQLGNVAAARALEDRLVLACPSGCDELDDLRAALEASN